MTITEIEHNIFERMVKNNNFKNNVEVNQETFKSRFITNISE